MRLTAQLSKNTTARALALVALLFAAALQVQEAGHDHWHGLDDSYSQCQVCKAGSAAALPPAGAPDLPPAASRAPGAIGLQATDTGFTHAFLARGPPHFS